MEESRMTGSLVWKKNGGVDRERNRSFTGTIEGFSRVEGSNTPREAPNAVLRKIKKGPTSPTNSQAMHCWGLTLP